MLLWLWLYWYINPLSLGSYFLLVNIPFSLINLSFHSTVNMYISTPFYPSPLQLIVTFNSSLPGCPLSEPPRPENKTPKPTKHIIVMCKKDLHYTTDPVQYSTKLNSHIACQVSWVSEHTIRGVGFHTPTFKIFEKWPKSESKIDSFQR